MFAGAFLYGIFSGRITEYRSKLNEEEELVQRKTQALDSVTKTYTLNPILYYSVLEKFRENKKEFKRPYDFSNLTPEQLDMLDHYKFAVRF